MEASEVKLYGMTLVYNESKMIPYIMPYYEKLGYDKLYVYDNESTDDTVEMLKKYPFVEIRTFSTGGKKNNATNKKLKEKFVKEFAGLDNTWMTIGDFDEVLFYDGNIKEYLYTMQQKGYDYLSQFMVEPLCKNFPDITDGGLVHEKTDKGYFWVKNRKGYWENGAKVTLINSKNVLSAMYSPGCHVCTLKLKNGKNYNLCGKEIKSFHIKYIDYDFCSGKMKYANSIRSDADRRARYGLQYEKLSKPERFNEAWTEKEKNAISIKGYLDGNEKCKEYNKYVTIKKV